MPKETIIAPTTNLIAFSGTRRSGARTARPATNTASSATSAAMPFDTQALAVQAEGDDDQPDLQPLQQRALVGDEPGGEPVALADLGLGFAKFGVLVVQRLQSGLPGDGLGEPADAEQQQEHADDELDQRAGSGPG